MRLRKRPEMLTEAFSTLSQTRSAAMLSSFLQALTRGHPSGLPRPIELHAHDPMRYMGDMFAWVHQTVAAERETLESLFGLDGSVGRKRRMVGEVRNFEYVEGEDEEWIAELLDRSVQKLCVPLKVRSEHQVPKVTLLSSTQNRVQQTIRSQESSITSYKIVNLLQFYLITMHRTIGPRAIISTTIQEYIPSLKVFSRAHHGTG